MKQILLKIIEENSGELSTMRSITLIWFVGTLLTWIVLSIYNVQLMPIPESILALLGVLIGGKVVQRKFEQPNNDPESSPKND